MLQMYFSILFINSRYLFYSFFVNYYIISRTFYFFFTHVSVTSTNPGVQLVLSYTFDCICCIYILWLFILLAIEFVNFNTVHRVNHNVLVISSN